MYKIIAIAAAALSLGGCATQSAVQPVVGASQTLTSQNSTAIVVSKTPHGVVRLAAPSSQVSGRVTLGLVVLNVGDMAANLGTENVQVFTAAGARVRVFTHDELVREAKSAAAWESFTVAQSVSANPFASSPPTAVGTYGSSYNMVGRYTKLADRTTSYSTLDAAPATPISIPQANESLSLINSSLDTRLGAVGSGLLKTTTVGPGNAVGGNIILDMPKFAKGEEQALRVVVSFQGEIHEFKFCIC